MNINTYNAYYSYEDGWWIPVRNLGAIFHIDSDGKNEFIGILRGGEKHFSSDIGKIISINEKVYFFSRVAYELWIYDKTQKRIDYHKYFDDDVEMISNVEIIKGNVWIFPNTIKKPVIVMDINDVNKCDLIDLEIGEDLSESITRTCVYKDSIYFMNRTKNNVHIFEINTDTRSIKNRKIKNASYVNCITVSDAFYFLFRNTDGESRLGITSKGFIDDEVTELPIDIQLPNNVSIEYFKMLYIDDSLFAISSNHGEIIEINPKTGSVKRYYNDDIRGYKTEPGAPVMNDIQVVNGNMYMFSPILGAIYVFSLVNKMFIKSSITINDIEFAQSVKGFLEDNNIIIENKQILLKDFVTTMLV